MEQVLLYSFDLVIISIVSYNFPPAPIKVNRRSEILRPENVTENTYDNQEAAVSCFRGRSNRGRVGVSTVSRQPKRRMLQVRGKKRDELAGPFF